MKRMICRSGLILMLFLSIVLKGQGSGFGYVMDLGGSNFSHSESYYDQSVRTITHNGFVRFHNKSGNNAVQLMLGFRSDTVSFDNHSYFLAPDGISLSRYNTSAVIRRHSWRFALINQFQFGMDPGRILFSLNAGLFYENTIRANRHGYSDDLKYTLDEELNKHNLGIILGGELRLMWFTVGCKYEKLFRDMLNHDYILSQELSVENSSELRGLKLNPGMFFITVGVNLDFFSKQDAE